ncbi:MAG TPA: hypothetical protein GX400_17835 [Chloroflexi bacterium]|nr:hypothetical protein [Chloroflexota bacterium]
MRNHQQQVWRAIYTGWEPRRILRIVGTLLALACIGAGIATQIALTPTVRAQQSGAILHDTVADFSPACVTNTGLTVSDALGGELRLAATLEDYFTGAAVDTTRWLVGSASPGYTAPVTVTNGVVDLTGMYLRSQANFAATQPRFFEARALPRVDGRNAVPTDLGFYRALSPLDPNAPTSTTAFRLFVTRTDNTVYALSRDGVAPNPAYSTDIPGVDLTQYHIYRVEWDGAETRYFVDGVQVAAAPGVATLDTYAFLYHQDPASATTSPLRVDWARAGQYISNGSFVSCVQDAGQPVAWQSLTLDATAPAGASITAWTRTSTDGVTWSDWALTSGAAIASPVGQFLQYRLDLATTNVLQSPEVRSVSLQNAPPTTPTNTPLPTDTPTATNTPLPPTATNTPEPPTATPTSTPTSTPTNTPTPVFVPVGPGGFVQTTTGDFAAPCAVLGSASVSDAAGGEVRLAATIEDYFSGAAIDTSRWLINYANTWYTVPPTIGGGIVTLDGSLLRSQINLQPYQPRFIEVRAQQRTNGASAGWPDIGFYRDQPPLTYGSTYPADSALRIFVTRDTNTTYLRGRDGNETQPLTDIDIPSLDLTQYHVFRIEWDAAGARFYIDGVLQGTISGAPTLNTWAFIYHQTPTTYGVSPMNVDWARVGQYATSGSYTSCIYDAGQAAPWGVLALDAVTPANTGVVAQTRTSPDGVNWSAWTPVSGSAINSPAARYFQYRLDLVTNDVMQSPEVRQVSVQFAGPTPTPTNTPLPTDTPTAGPTPTSLPPTATFTPPPTATLTPTPTAATSTNNALQFDGVNDFLSAGASVGGGPFTVEMWLRPGAANETGIVVLAGNDNSGWSFEMENGRIVLWVRTNQGWQSASHPTVLQAGTWYHAAAVYNAGLIQLFVNGQATGAATVGNTLTQGPLLQMGVYAGYPAFAGALDDVRISNVPRYNASFAVPTAPHAVDANTVDLWRFDEGAGQLTADSAGALNTATLGASSAADAADPAWVAGYPFPNLGPTATPTNTPLPPTATNTPAPTNTPTPGPSPTPTNTPLPPTATNTPTNTPVPPANSALTFDGANDFVQAARSVSASRFTVEAWVRPAAANANGIMLAEADDNNGWSLELDAGRPILWLSTNAGWQGVLYPTTLPAGQWAHVAAVYDNGAVRLFVNGVATTPATVGATLRITPSGLRMGGVPGYAYFAGALDDVRISASVRYTANFTPPATLPAVDVDTLAQWAFNEGAGQSVADASANARTGTLGASTAAGADDPVWGAANR